MCDTYLLSYYKKEITDILEDPDDTKHFSINVEFVELIGNDTALAKNFLEEPEKALKEWDIALRKIQTSLILESESRYIYKSNCHCRIYKFPLYPDFHRIKFPLDDDLNKFLEVTGTVIRMTALKMLEYQRQYICTKCKYVMTVDAIYQLKNIIEPPETCMNPENCKSTNVVPLGELNADFCKDYQEIKIQETISKLDVGSIPNSMWVTLEDDLVDSCKPGDNVTICGFIKLRHEPFYPGKKMDVEVVIKANHVRVDNASSSAISIEPKLKDMFHAFWKTYADKPLVARDIILKSICPQLFGLFTVKLAMAVVLAGGSHVQNNSSTGVRIRTEPHLLLVGDPGTGKSQLLRFASKVIPRSVLTTGIGSTAAGLTVAAVMENGEWQLEGGALVMADGGICCIDEFNTMKEHDRTSIHEAMEQQTISVAKASIVCKLSTRCSVLAATNPKGNLDPSQPLNMNIALASPLLSRFDLILLIRDRIDEEWDSQMVDYIFASEQKSVSTDLNWTVETLQAYYAVIKNIHPILTEDSNKILSSYYQAQRRKNSRNKSRTTVRLLDSLVRLSQGHARLMCHEEVRIVDAVTAVILVEASTDTDSSVFNLNFDVRVDFPHDPMKNYQELVEVVLSKLGLNELLKKEMEWIYAKKTDGRSPKSTENTSRQKESKYFACSENTASEESGEKLIQNDLAALKCMRSINDVFPEDDENLEENTNENAHVASVNEDQEAAGSHKKEGKEPNQNPFESEDGHDFADISVTNSRPKDDEAKNIEEPMLTQRTKTKNFFSRFRCIPKDNDIVNQRPEGESKATVGDFGDISFANVQSSTQSEVPAPAPVDKRFTFKKVTNTNVRVGTSMFESQEDLDSLDLDI